MSTLVRSLGIVSALVLAFHFGAGIEMDHYMALAMVASNLGALIVSPLSVVVSKQVASAASFSDAALACRDWGGRLSRMAFCLVLPLAPFFAWAMTPAGSEDTFPGLIALFLLGLPSLAIAPRAGVEQALLQARGRAYAALWCSGITTGVSLLAALLSGFVGGVYLCALGLGLGSFAEYWLVRRLNRVAERSRPAAASAPAKVPFPWKTALTLTGASAGVLLTGFLDQALLAQLGTGVQATWGLATRLPSFLSLSLFAAAGVLCTASFARWQAESEARLRAGALRLFGLILGLSTFIMGALWMGALPLTQLLFERGAFTAGDSVQVAEATRLAVLAYLLYPASVVLVRSSGVRAQHRLLLRAAGLYFVVKVALAWLTYESLGLWGIATSTLVAGLAQLALLLWAVCRR